MATFDGDTGHQRQDEEEFAYEVRREDGIDLIVGPRQLEEPPICAGQARPVRVSLFVLKTLEHDLLGRRQAKRSIVHVPDVGMGLPRFRGRVASKRPRRPSLNDSAPGIAQETGPEASSRHAPSGSSPGRSCHPTWHL